MPASTLTLNGVAYTSNSDDLSAVALDIALRLRTAGYAQAHVQVDGPDVSLHIGPPPPVHIDVPAWKLTTPLWPVLGPGPITLAAALRGVS